MKHKIISEAPIDKRNKLFIVELIPDLEIEAIAIKKAEKPEASKMVDDYLLFCLGDRYSGVQASPIGNRKFKLAVFDNLFS